MTDKPKKYDYTASKRNIKARNQAAGRVPAVLLDQKHSDALGKILAHSDETASAWVRRMIRLDAAKTTSNVPASSPDMIGLEQQMAAAEKTHLAAKTVAASAGEFRDQARRTLASAARHGLDVRAFVLKDGILYGWRGGEAKFDISVLWTVCSSPVLEVFTPDVQGTSAEVQRPADGSGMCQ